MSTYSTRIDIFRESSTRIEIVELLFYNLGRFPVKVSVKTKLIIEIFIAMDYNFYL